MLIVQGKWGVIPLNNGTQPSHTRFDSAPKVIAGKGSDVEIRVIDRLVSKYGGNKNEWQRKCRKLKVINMYLMFIGMNTMEYSMK